MYGGAPRGVSTIGGYSGGFEGISPGYTRFGGGGRSRGARFAPQSAYGQLGLGFDDD
jgi:hypothetical protein